MPAGSYQIEVYGLAQPPLYALALSAVPPGPIDYAGLQPYLLPYAPSPVALQPDQSWYVADPLAGYNGSVTFAPAPGVPSLPIAGIALVWLSDPPVLSSQVVAIDPPVVPPSAGWVVIPLYRTILAAYGED